MDEARYGNDGRPDPEQPTSCEAELHMRLCARRTPTGHLQFRWRVETVDNVVHSGDSLEGTFGAFELPHECGNTMAKMVRTWMKHVAHNARLRQAELDDGSLGVQLTLSDVLPQ